MYLTKNYKEKSVMKKFEILWKENGWVCLQEADAEKHILEINALVENDKVVDVKIRHNDGEEQQGVITLDGENPLPMKVKDFAKLFGKGKFEIK